MRVRGDAETKIDAALRLPTQLEFTDTPLTDVIDYFKDYHQVEIQLDKRIFGETGIGTDMPITQNLKGVSLKAALKQTLKPLGLDYVVANGVILITTQAEADKLTPVRVYSQGPGVVPITTESWGQPQSGLEGVGSLKIQLEEPAAADRDVLTFRSLGTEPELVLTLADRGRFDALAWGLALAVALVGVAMTNRPVRNKVSFIFAVALAATLLPLAWDDVEIVRTCNMVFFAASLLVPYYLLVGLLKWSLRGLCHAHCSCAVPSKAVAAGLAAVFLAAMAGGALAQTAKVSSPAPRRARLGGREDRGRLVRPATLNFTETPLADVVDKLKAQNKIAIQLDKKVLDDSGIGTGVQLTFSVKGVSLRAALRLMLRGAGLAYVIEHGAILITTAEEAGRHVTTVAYPVTDLLEKVRDAGGKIAPDVESLSEAIRSTIQPTTWDEVGGLGTIAARTQAGSTVLDISQTQDAHRQIAALLRGLREAKQSAAGGKENYAPLCVPPPGAAEQKIEAALDCPAELNLDNATLTDVVGSLKDRYKIEIQLDRKAMNEAGIGADVTVTKVLKGVTLRSALRLMLRELGLAYVIEDEVLLITTTEAAESNLATVIYPVTDLVSIPGRAWEDDIGVPDLDALKDTIHSTVAPTAWDTVGGPGSITPISVGKARLLIISQTEEVHEEIAALLAGLREARRLTPGGKDACRPVSLHKRTPAEEKIIEALASPTQLQFSETPLSGVIDYLKGRHHIDIQLDMKGVDEAGIGADRR